MELETAERIQSANVTEEELINAFQDDYGRGEYIILKQPNGDFMQAAGEEDDMPYALEYSEGDGAHHFQCVRDVTKKEAEITFLKYLKKDMFWKTDFEWKQLENHPWWKFWNR